MKKFTENVKICVFDDPKLFRKIEGILLDMGYSWTEPGERLNVLPKVGWVYVNMCMNNSLGWSNMEYGVNHRYKEVKYTELMKYIKPFKFLSK